MEMELPKINGIQLKFQKNSHFILFFVALDGIYISYSHLFTKVLPILSNPHIVHYSSHLALAKRKFSPHCL
jgi:hypothetical protein